MLLMRCFSCSMFLLLAVAFSTKAALISYDFESLSVGSLQGQDGWGFAANGDITVVNDVTSPLDGSSKSIRFAGQATGIHGELPIVISSGQVKISYDFFSTTRVSGDNAMAVLQFQDSNRQIPMELYVQNGGAGPSPNGHMRRETTPEVLDWNNLIMQPFQKYPYQYPENRWLRFECVIDLNDEGHLVSAEAFDISGGTLNQIGYRNNAVDGDLYFAKRQGNQDVLPELKFINLLGGGMDNGTVIYLDNIRIEHSVPEPEMAYLLIFGVFFLAGGTVFSAGGFGKKRI